MADLKVFYGEGAQAVRTVPMRNGRAVVVGSATFELHDLGYPEDSASRILASGAASIDSVSTMTSAATGRGASDPRAVTVASATGITAGRRYLIQQGGRSELVEVEAVSSTTVRFRVAVAQPFPSGSSFLGVEVSATVPDAVTSEDDYLGASNLAVRWECGDLAPVLEPIFLERYVTASIITRQDVLNLDRTLAGYDGEGLGLDLAIAQAQSDLSIDLLSAGHDDSRVMAGPIGREALKHAAAYHALKHAMGEAEVRRAEHYLKRYSELRANLLIGLDKAKVTHLDAEGTKKPIELRSIFVGM